MRTFIREYMSPLMMMGLLAVVAYDHFGPRRDAATPTIVDGARLGRDYAPALSASLSDAWLDAAAAIEQGKTVAEAQTVLQDRFKAGRVQAFTANVAPAFSRVLPEGIEPRDSAHRAEVASLWRAFARGLKGGK